MRRAFLLLLAGVALRAGCGGGGDDEADGPTIQELQIAYTSGARALTADTWTLRNGDDLAARSRLRQGSEVLSDVALEGGFLAAYTAEAGGVVESPAGTAASPDPFTIADGLVEDGTLTAAGTAQRDGREVHVYTGSPEYFLLGGGQGSFEPADAELRYLRDEASGRPVELLIPAATLRGTGVPPARVPQQRYIVTGARDHPATEEAMEVFDVKAIYDAAPTTTPVP